MSVDAVVKTISKDTLLSNRMMPAVKNEGFALLTVVVVILILGVIAVSSMRVSNESESLSGNAIQRSRAFQAADGGASLGEIKLVEMLKNRVFANSAGSSGIFLDSQATQHWWRDDAFSGSHSVDHVEMLGVIEQPRFIFEEVGLFSSDGGTGVANLDVGAAAYGRVSNSGREVVLYRIESKGTGTTTETGSVVETLYAQPL